MATVQNLSQYFLKGSVEGFSKKIAPITAFAYAVQHEGASYNDVVRVPYAANASGSSTYALGTGFTSTSGNGVAGKAVTLNQLLYQPIWIEDSEMVKLNPESLVALGNVAGARLASDFISASFASMLISANYGIATGITSSFFNTSSHILALETLCDNLDWPDEGRVLVTTPSIYQTMLNNTNLTLASAYGNPQAVQKGLVNQIFGFTPYKVTTGCYDYGFVAHPSAMAFAFAPFQPSSAEGNSLVDTQVGVDEKSGLVVTLRSWYDPTLASTKKVLCVLGGVTAVNTNALLRLAY